MSFRQWATAAVLAAVVIAVPGYAAASDFAVSQYGRVTATLPWAVAMEKGFFADTGLKIDHIISGEGWPRRPDNG
jgi:ABC-type nitrate/sulfonate/bicarbonate transport system substrate-binding protein